MIALIIPSLFLAISQGILTNRVIERWEQYDQEDIQMGINYLGQPFYAPKNRINGGALNPLFWGISSGFLGTFTWITYISGYILTIAMISSVYNGYDHTYFGILISQLILWINSYTYGKMLGYVFVFLTFIVVYLFRFLFCLFKFLFIVPVYFIDDLLQGNLRKSDSKVKDYINKSLEVFNFIIKD